MELVCPGDRIPIRFLKIFDSLWTRDAPQPCRSRATVWEDEMTAGWSLAALTIMVTASAVRALFAFWRHRRWLDSVDHLAEVVQPGHRITCRDADGAVVEITPGAGTVGRMGSAGTDSAKVPGCDVPC